MKKLPMIAVASLFAANVTAAPCDGFEIRLENKLNESIVFSSMNFTGAGIYPGVTELGANSKQTTTLSATAKNVPIMGEFVFHTVNEPIRSGVIKLTLKNGKAFVCKHHDFSSKDSLLKINDHRGLGVVTYTIK